MKNLIKIIFLSIFAIPAAHAMDANLNAQLRKAASNGNPTLIQQLIEAKADVNSTYKNGATVLMIAAYERGSLPCVKTLIAAKADVNKKGGDLIETALMWVSSVGFLSCIETLLAANADVNCANALGNTALMHTIQYNQLSCTQALIKAGAQVNHKNISGCTALHWATANGNLSSVQTLIAAKAHINSMDNNGHTPLWNAAESINAEEIIICEELVNALLKLPNKTQKQSILTFLGCGTKQKELFRIYQVPKDIARLIAKLMLEACEQKNRTNFVGSVASDEVDKIENESIKNNLFKKYNPKKQNVLSNED